MKNLLISSAFCTQMGFAREAIKNQLVWLLFYSGLCERLTLVPMRYGVNAFVNQITATQDKKVLQISKQEGNSVLSYSFVRGKQQFSKRANRKEWLRSHMALFWITSNILLRKWLFQEL